MKINIEQLEPKLMMTTYKDVEISSLMKTFYSDSYIDRNEAVELFRSTADNNSVDKDELTDIRSIFSTKNMAEPIRVLAQNIISNPSNRSTGNYNIGTQSSTINFLINKWYFGSDRPSLGNRTGIEYRPISGSLFVNGINSTDIKQGNLGDCYMVAVLAAIADKTSSIIQGMIRPNGDETFTVRFYRLNRNQLVPDYVTVDNQLPVNITSGRSVFASFGNRHNDPSNELWVSLTEKAYAQWAATGYASRSRVANSYDAIGDGGFSNVVFRQIIGSSDIHQTFNMQATNTESILVDAALRGKPIVVYRYMTRNTGHAYFLKSYADGKFYLYNPWGYGHLTLTIQDIRRTCYGFAIANKSTL